ncbi:Rbm19 [Symbiodinium sp. KB8]|nr:Rbm19 [Symbiodinium sp. KB8]
MASALSEFLHSLPSGKELYQLFGAYGTVTSCRLPKKSDYSGHRGFAFIDFASRGEAAAAFEALQHSHLYGRRLVIEPAEEKSNDVENVQAEAAKRTASKVRASEAKKRRKSGVLNATGEAGSFEDALMS